jgi:hypothetical protein
MGPMRDGRRFTADLSSMNSLSLRFRRGAEYQNRNLHGPLKNGIDSPEEVNLVVLSLGIIITFPLMVDVRSS